ISCGPEVKDMDPMECPLCMEPLEIDDANFYPCTCGYQICRFCWHRIRTDENGLCPACRKPYPEDPAMYNPLSAEELQRIKNEKKAKQVEKKQKTTENRKHLASVRVVQRNLVFLVGLSQRLADPEVLKRPEYFVKFGKVHKVVINNSTSYAGSQGPSASAYVTYIRSEDALRAIQCVNNLVVDGRTLKASLGTTKYCSYFLKSMGCPKPDCMYLHELGDDAASFTKEEMQREVEFNSSYSDSPSPPPVLPGPPGFSKASQVVPISVTARSPFQGAAAESQSLFSDNSNFRHPNPIPSGLHGFPGTSTHNNHDTWPTAPEPHSLFTSDTMPVSSSTDWQAAFGFGSSKQQTSEDDLGFDPFDVTRKALEDLIEKELSIQDSLPSLCISPGPFPPHHHSLLSSVPTKAGPGPPGELTPRNHFFSGLNSGLTGLASNHCFSQMHQHPQQRAVYNSFSFPGQPPSSSSSSSSSFLDLMLPSMRHHSTGLGGIAMTGNTYHNNVYSAFGK
uniref:CCR4-NOT transcription complex subunit 4 n=1 Tax=Hucho hucho TaxID=62062 RepID=A0A4W5JZ00_9TELE